MPHGDWIVRAITWLRPLATRGAPMSMRSCRDAIGPIPWPAGIQTSRPAMRIGVDARELCGNRPASAAIFSGLLRAWSADAVANPTHSSSTRMRPSRRRSKSPVARLPGHLAPHGAAVTSCGDTAGRSRRALCAGYTRALFLKIPTVLTVHDISFVAHPEWFRWKEGLRRRTLTRWSSRRASLVLTDSDASRREIMSYFSLAPTHVRCIHPGVDPLPSRLAASREPMVLFVGSLLNRRHLPDLIRAFKAIARTHDTARLEIVGDNRRSSRNVQAIAATEGLASRVSIRPYVPMTSSPISTAARARLRSCPSTRASVFRRWKR